jgi:putative colanic acid biosysnthesis UDP-glucose lipid carrier transferase
MENRILPLKSAIHLMMQCMDGIFIVLSLVLLVELYKMPWHDGYFWFSLIGIVMFHLFARFNDLYNLWEGDNPYQEMGKVLGAWVFTTFFLLFFLYGSKTSVHFSRRVIFTWIVVAPIFVLFLRQWLKKILGIIRFRQSKVNKVLIIGAGPLGERIATSMVKSPWHGLQLEGFIDDFKPIGYKPNPDFPGVIATIDDIKRIAQDLEVNRVYVTLPMRDEKRMMEVVNLLADTNISVYVVPDLFIFDLMNAHWTDVAGVPAINILGSPFLGLKGGVKRLEDLVFTPILILIFAIPMVAIAIGVRFSSSGPIIFKQKRWGLDGREIIVWKFRTMTTCSQDTETTFTQATKNDSRTTHFGHFLRSTSLDELPQFFNVIQGQLSLVGPRPLPLGLNKRYLEIIPKFMQRHKVKPGITGLAQVSGWRGETDSHHKMEKRVEKDMYYIRNWSLWLDLKIMIITPLSCVTNKDIY